MVINKAFLHLFILFLGVSCVFSAIYAVPATRSLKPTEQQQSVLVHGSQPSQAAALMAEMLKVDDGYITSETRRMAVENTYDYPGTGANNHHDPKTPATKP